MLGPAPRSPRLLRLADDDKLVAFVRGGSQAAFEVVYDRHHRGILSFCRHMLGTQHEAEDALQHTFMAAYRDLVGSDKDIQLRAWLYTIARNRCLSMLRARRERPVDELDEIPTEGLAQQVQVRHDLQDMLRDLAALPEEQREALVLSELGAMPHEEIAVVLGCPKDKVKALVFQARSSLHSSREARETDCTDIREMLANLRGGSLRRTQLRRHLRDCEGCKAFADDVKRQRKAIAVLLPVVPAVGLKEQALAAAFGSAQAAGTAAVGTAAGVAAGSAVGGAAATGGVATLVAKGLVIAAVATGGVAGGVTGVNAIKGEPARDGTPASQNSNGPKTPLPATAPVAAEPTPDAQDASKKAKAKKDAEKLRGKENAKTRGKGLKRGLFGTQPAKATEKAARKAERKLERERKAAAKKKKAKRLKKAKLRAKAQPTPTPRAKPEATPRPDKTPRSSATPVPTAEPVATPIATAVPTSEPTGSLKGGGGVRDK